MHPVHLLTSVMHYVPYCFHAERFPFKDAPEI